MVSAGLDWEPILKISPTGSGHKIEFALDQNAARQPVRDAVVAGSARIQMDFR